MKTGSGWILPSGEVVGVELYNHFETLSRNEEAVRLCPEVEDFEQSWNQRAEEISRRSMEGEHPAWHAYESSKMDDTVDLIDDLYTAGLVRIGVDTHNKRLHFEGRAGALSRVRSLAKDLTIEYSAAQGEDFEMKMDPKPGRESGQEAGQISEELNPTPETEAPKNVTPSWFPTKLIDRIPYIDRDALIDYAAGTKGTPEQQEEARRFLQSSKNPVKGFTRLAGLYAPPFEQTGYCPDHPHIRLARVPGLERVYVCPLDGKRYDFNLGFEKEDGTFVPGSSVEQQIPDWMGNKY